MLLLIGLLTYITVFLPFFGLCYVLKTASFQRFLDITGVAVICGHAAVTCDRNTQI